jgi:hypothetical protein
MVIGNYQLHNVGRGDMSMNCALDYPQSSAKNVATANGSLLMKICTIPKTGGVGTV